MATSYIEPIRVTQCEISQRICFSSTEPKGDSEIRDGKGSVKIITNDLANGFVELGPLFVPTKLVIYCD